MSIVYKELRDIAMYVEPDGSFADNASGSAAYVSLPTVNDGLAVTISRDPIHLNRTRQKKFDRSKSKLGRKNAGLTLPMHLEGATTALSATVTPGAGPYYGRVLQSQLGGLYASQGAGVASGTGGGEFSVDTGEGSRIKAGAIIARLNATTGKVECRPVRSVSTDSVEMLLSFGETPGSGDLIYGAYSYYPIQNPTGSLQFLCTGAEDDDVFVLRGLNGGFGINLNPEGLNTISFELEGASWDSGSAGSVARKEYDEVEIPRYLAGEVILAPSGSMPIDGSAVEFSSLEITPNFAWHSVMGVHGTEGVTRRVLSPTPQDEGAVTVTITLYMEDLSYLEHYENATDMVFMAQFGTEAGNIHGVCLPRCQIINIEPLSDANDGLLGQTITLAAYHNSYAEPSSGYEELAESPVIFFSA